MGIFERKEYEKNEMQRQAGISGNILARMGKNQSISMESVEKICCLLNCRTDDILEFIPEGDK